MNLPKGSGLEQLRNIVDLSLKQYQALFEEIKKINIDLPARKYTLKRNFNMEGLLTNLKKATEGGILDPKRNPVALGNISKRINADAKELFSQNPLKGLFKGINSMIGRFTGSSEAEDYKAVVSSFIPVDAGLLKPRYPRKSDEIHVADLDGDSKAELVATYKTGNSVRTIILRNASGHWFKAAEIDHPEHDGINLRSVEDLTGNGKPQLIIGLTAQGKPSTVYCYSLDGDCIARKLFSRNYDWAEIVSQPQTRGGAQKAHIALWNRDANGHYDIDLLSWNGLMLEPSASTALYYARRVVPYYVRRVKLSPASMHGWYRLADSLKRAGASRDAHRIAHAALKQSTDPALRDKFSSLM